MNFGGLVAGAVQGFAKGGEAIADDQIKRNDRMALLRAEMDAKLRQELAQEQRLGQWADRVEQGAKSRGEQRDLGLVGDIKKAVPDEGPFAGQELTEADKEMLRNLSPEQRKAFGMEDKTLLRDLQLQGEEARATGAPKAIRDGIKEGQSAEVARMREDRGERTAAANERTANARLDAQAARDAETARANREAERIAGLRAEALMQQARAAEIKADKYQTGGGKKAGSDEPKRTDLEASKKVLMERLKLEVGGKNADEVADEIGFLQRRAAKGDAAAVAKLARVQTIQEQLTAKEDEILGYKQPPKALAPAPAAPKIDTSQALTDAKRVLFMNPGARDEVIRRLKAAGIDTKGL